MSTDAISMNGESLVAARRPPRKLPKFMRHTSGVVGMSVATIVILVALFGPFFAPHSPNTTVGVPFSTSSGAFPLGTDFLGRDVLSRLLAGGRGVLLLSLAATVVAYLLGATAGLLAGYKGSWTDGIVMRCADVLLAFPPLIFLLVVATGAGQNLFALVIAIGLIQSPGLARIIRAAVLEVSNRGFVEAAVARGESSTAIIVREILPNIVSVIAADIGLRLTYSVLLLASVSFLGLGVQPPTADWARMISENQQAITSQPWAVIAPAVLLGALSISVNLVADAVARTIGVSLDAVEAEGVGR